MVFKRRKDILVDRKDKGLFNHPENIQIFIDCRYKCTLINILKPLSNAFFYIRKCMHINKLV